MKFRIKIYYFFINELRQLKKAPLPIILALVMPVIAWLILTFTFQHGNIEQIPIAVVDLDNSSLSRKITSYLDATQALDVSYKSRSYQDAYEAMQNQKVFSIIVLNENLEKDIKRGNSSSVKVVTNAAFLLYSKISYRAIAQTLMTVSTGIQIRKFEVKGFKPDIAMNYALPVRTEINVMGNSYLNYGFYLIPGMIFAILQMSASFSTLWLFRQHREHLAGRIIPRKGQKAAFFIGKITPVFLANTLSVIIIYLLISPLAKVPLNSSSWLLILFTLLLTYVSMGMGALLSVSLANLVTSSQLLLILNAPAFVISGYTFPRWAMPEALQYFSNIVPVTHFLNGFFSYYIFDNPTTTGLLELIIMGIVLWGLTWLMLTKFGIFWRKLVKI